MALSRRNLIQALAYTCMALLSSSVSFAQSASELTQSFRTLGVRRAAPTLFYNIGSEEIPLFAGDSSLSGKYKAPKSGVLELYCYVPAAEPELPPVKVILAETKLPGPSENFVLIASAANEESVTGAPSIAVRAVDASLEAHPLDTIRVFNFSKRRTATKVGETFAEIPSGGDAFFDFPEGNKVWVQIAAYEGIETGWKLRNGGPKAIFPDTRSLIILSDAYPSESDPKGERLNLRNVIDSNPPAPRSP